MSGIEGAAGLALAILPLVLSAAKGYDNIMGPFLRYKRFAKEAKMYSRELDIQRTIFRNECRNLLEEIIEHDAASGMLDSLTREIWSDHQLEDRLVQQLGESKQACVSIIELIEERLQIIECENSDFSAIVEQERQVSNVAWRWTQLWGGLLLTSPVKAMPKSLRPKGWRQSVGKKLCFSFSKSRLDQNINALRTHNDDLRTICSHTRTRAAPVNNCQLKVSRASRKDVQKYQTIGKASQQVYEALGNACSKHSEHIALFRVEVEHLILNESAPQVKFSMAFTQMQLAGSTGSFNPIWFLVDSTLTDETATRSDKKDLNLDELGRTLKRQFDADAGQIAGKSKKRVNFEILGPEPVPSTPLIVASDAFSSEDCTKRDFCDSLRRCFREPRKANICVGILEKTDKGKHYVYPSPLTLDFQRRGPISLGQLIRSASRPALFGDIPVHERLGLAKTLAVAVLQYHSTPWLRLSWRSDDILFFGADETTQMQELPNLSAPHLSAKMKGPHGQLSCASTKQVQKMARNPIMFSLGVVLLEIAHAASLKSLRQDNDLTNGQEDPYTEFFTARRLAKSKRSVMGITYHNIVEQLVECVFPCGDDLNNDQLQAAFHSSIICPLAELEEGFRKFHLAE